MAIDGFIAQGHYPLNHDAGWLLIASSRMLGGLELYGPGIIENNPPLIIWLLLPISWLAEHLSWSELVIFRIAVFVLAAGMAALAGELLCRIGSGTIFPARTLVISLLLVLLVWLPGYDFGQREHLFLAGSIVWISYIAGESFLNWPGRTLRLVLLFVLSLLIALKPFFLVPFMVVQARLLSRNGVRDRLYNESIWVVGATFVAYLAIIWIVHPRYFAEIVPLTMQHYGAYSYPLAEMLRPGHLGLIIATGVMAAALRGRPRVGTILEIAWYWGVGCYLAFLIQGKGWSYHLLPFVGVQVFIVGLALMTWLCEWHNIRKNRKPAPGVAILAAIAAFSLALFAAFRIKSYTQPLPENLLTGDCVSRCGETLRVFSNYAQGGSVYYFSTKVSDPFPAVNYAQVKWASRYSTLWLLPAIAKADDESKKTLAITLQSSVTEDFKKYAPNVVIVDTSKEKTYLGAVEFDYLEFFQAYDDFRRLWENYTLVESLQGREIYLLRN